MENELQKTHFKIVVLNETQYWSTEIVAKAKVLFRAYLFDANIGVHCCEITPSYELHPIYTSHFGDDQVDMEIMAAEDNDVVYMHCSSIDRMLPGNFHDIGEAVLPEDESWEEALERTLDHYRGNHAIQFPAGFTLAQAA